MSTFAEQLKSEIARIAKKEIRAESKALKTLAAQQRAELAILRRRVAELETDLKRWRRTGAASVSASAARNSPQVGAAKNTKKAQKADGVTLRFRAGGFATLRQKLGLTAAQMAQLLGVSPQSVYHWEAGKSRPRASQLPAIAAVRQLGKKQAAERLAA